jgi:hypothetical protein
MFRLATSLAVVLSVLGPVTAQQPKKVNPQLAVEAAKALDKFGCKLHFDDTAAGAPVDLVWFPPKTNDAELARLVGHAARLPGLKMIDLGRTAVTDGGLKELARLPNLESVYLDNTPVTDAGVKSLANIERLAWLDVTGTKVTAQSTDTLARCKALHHLFLGAVNLKTEDVARIATLDKLRSLGVGSLPDEAVPELGKLPDLKDLRLARLGPAGVAALSKLPKLESLQLRDALGRLTADGWKTVAGLADLKALDLGGFAHDDWAKYAAWDRKKKPAWFPAAADALGDVRGLKKLDLAGLSVGDDVLKPVARLGSLEELDLCCTLVTFEDAKDLAGLGRLQRLNVRNANVTDRGLRAMEALKDLRQLLLYDNSVSEAGVNRLQKALPRCAIYWKYAKGSGDHRFRVPGGYGK